MACPERSRWARGVGSPHRRAQAVRIQITPSGNITYNAPSGYHDDCVIALALANSERYQFKWSGAIRLVAAAPRAARLRARGRVLAG